MNLWILTLSRLTIRIDIGTRFGKLVVVSRLSDVRNRYAKYLCVCDCGRTSTPTGTSLKTGNSKGCGICYKLNYCVPDSALTRAYRTYKRNAKKKNVTFQITFPEFKGLTSRPCHYCGLPPVVNSYSDEAKVKIPMNGVDRVDSLQGYTLLNCVACCTTCNLAKLDTSLADFKTWVRRVHTHLFDFGKESE
jgi:hypothetical protein